jgi:carbon-monoxide dehydrogenase medium subunit
LKHFRQYLVAGSIDEAVALRKDVGPKSLYIAGGTTVVPYASQAVDVLIDITGLGLDEIADHGDLVSIGATARLARLLRSDIGSDIPILRRAVSAVGSPALRNMATVGGSLAGVFLPSDLGIALLAVGAELRLEGDGQRSVEIGDLLAGGWLSGYDLITEVRVRKRQPGAGSGFAKFGRSAVDTALVNAAAALEVSGRTLKRLRIAVGQSGSRPVVLEGPDLKAEGMGLGTDLVGELAEKAARSVKPRADARASADYRKHLVQVMVARALGFAAEEAGVDLGD